MKIKLEVEIREPLQHFGARVISPGDFKSVVEFIAKMACWHAMHNPMWWAVGATCESTGAANHCYSCMCRAVLAGRPAVSHNNGNVLMDDYISR